MIYRFYPNNNSSYSLNIYENKNILEKYNGNDIYNILGFIDNLDKSYINIVNGNLVFKTNSFDVEIINIDRFMLLEYSNFIPKLVNSIRYITSVYSKNYFDNVKRENKKLKPRKVKLGSLSYLILGSKKYYSNNISYDGCNKNDDFEEIRIK